MTYRVFETEHFTKNLDQIVQGGARRIHEKLRERIYPQLRQSPHLGQQIKRLRGFDPPTWRVRVREWRFFYEIDERAKTVFMTAAHHRKEAYRR